MKTIMVEYYNPTEVKISFSFDRENVERIKTIEPKYRKYEPEGKFWIVHGSKLEELKKLFEDYIAIEGGLEDKLQLDKPATFDSNFKISAFKGSFELIHNEKVRKFAKWVTANAPDYFFEIPASSTGKYHPKYSLGVGGLLRHTLGALVFANHLFPLYNFNQLEQDLIITSLIMHDMAKNGIKIENGKAVQESNYTVTEHPIAICEYIEYLYKENPDVDEDIIYVFNNYWDIIKGNIQSHMGQWNKNKTGEEILPIPITSSQRFTHLCDFLSSRKNVLIEELL